MKTKAKTNTNREREREEKEGEKKREKKGEGGREKGEGEGAKHAQAILKHFGRGLQGYNVLMYMYWKKKGGWKCVKRLKPVWAKEN